MTYHNTVGVPHHIRDQIKETQTETPEKHKPPTCLRIRSPFNGPKPVCSFFSDSPLQEPYSIIPFRGLPKFMETAI